MLVWSRLKSFLEILILSYLGNQCWHLNIIESILTSYQKKNILFLYYSRPFPITGK